MTEDKPKKRDDNTPGYVYIIIAEGYHGIIPGYYLTRCKIGLSRQPDLRMKNFISNQPPCNFSFLEVIPVLRMKSVEDVLHAKFKGNNVKLLKSTEWFDFYPWDFWRLKVYLSLYQNKSGFWRFIAKLWFGI